MTPEELKQMIDDSREVEQVIIKFVQDRSEDIKQKTSKQELIVLDGELDSAINDANEQIAKLNKFVTDNTADLTDKQAKALNRLAKRLGDVAEGAAKEKSVLRIAIARADGGKGGAFNLVAQEKAQVDADNAIKAVVAKAEAGDTEELKTILAGLKKGGKRF